MTGIRKDFDRTKITKNSGGTHDNSRKKYETKYGGPVRQSYSKNGY